MSARTAARKTIRAAREKERVRVMEKGRAVARGIRVRAMAAKVTTTTRARVRGIIKEDRARAIAGEGPALAAEEVWVMFSTSAAVLLESAFRARQVQ